MKIFKKHLGTIARSKRDDRAYLEYKQSHGDFCDLCDIESSASEVLSEYTGFMVVTNAFPYSVWDGGKVIDHIMLVPKRHIDSITDFTPLENAEFTKLLAEYDKRGYSFYGRAVNSMYKSITHQHTHLMKVGKPIKIHLFNFKPYINFFK